MERLAIRDAQRLRSQDEDECGSAHSGHSGSTGLWSQAAPHSPKASNSRRASGLGGVPNPIPARPSSRRTSHMNAPITGQNYSNPLAMENEGEAVVVVPVVHAKTVTALQRLKLQDEGDKWSTHSCPSNLQPISPVKSPGTPGSSVTLNPLYCLGDMERFYVPKSAFDKVLQSVTTHPDFSSLNTHLSGAELTKLRGLAFPRKHVMAPAAFLEEGHQYPRVEWVDGGQVDLCIVSAVYNLFKDDDKVEYTDEGEKKPRMEVLKSLKGLEASITMVGSLPGAEMIFSPQHVVLESNTIKHSRININMSIKRSNSFAAQKGNERLKPL